MSGNHDVWAPSVHSVAAPNLIQCGLVGKKFIMMYIILPPHILQRISFSFLYYVCNTQPRAKAQMIN
jgi:hypothetical protein